MCSSKITSPLHLAARYGHADCIDKLEQLVVDPDAVDENGVTALWYACKYNHYNAYQSLMKTGVSPFPVEYNSNYDIDMDLDDSSDSDGKFSERPYVNSKLLKMPSYPLHEAARHGNFSIMTDLVENILNDMNNSSLNKTHISLDIKETVFGGETALMLAVLHSRHDCARHLVEKGADKYVLDEHQRTVFHRTVIPDDNKFALELMSKPIHNLQDCNGLTLYHVLALEEKEKNMINYIFNAQDPKMTFYHIIPDDRGYTPLHYAAFTGNMDFINSYIDNFVDILRSDEYNDFDRTMIAIFKKIFGLDKNLSADSHFQDELLAFYQKLEFTKFTPLHCAVYGDHETVAEALIQFIMELEPAEKNRLIVDEYGRSPLHIASMRFHECMSVDRIDEKETLSDMVNILLAECSHDVLSPADRINHKDNKGLTASMIAAIFNNKNCLDKLIDSGNVDFMVVDKLGDTVLTKACKSSSKEAGEFLLENLQKDHAIIKHVNHAGDTALHIAAKMGLYSIVDDMSAGNESLLTLKNGARFFIFTNSRLFH